MVARIYKPAKTAMQSGKAGTKRWVLEYEPEAPRRRITHTVGIREKNAVEVAQQVHAVLAPVREPHGMGHAPLSARDDPGHRQVRRRGRNVLESAELEVNDGRAFNPVRDFQHVALAVAGLDPIVEVTLAAELLPTTGQPVQLLQRIAKLVDRHDGRIAIEKLDGWRRFHA